jgi:hypothetical protein
MHFIGYVVVLKGTDEPIEYDKSGNNCLKILVKIQWAIEHNQLNKDDLAMEDRLIIGHPPNGDA